MNEKQTCCLQETSNTWVKDKRMEKLYHSNNDQERKVRVGILISDEVDFRATKTTAGERRVSYNNKWANPPGSHSNPKRVS